MQRSNNRGTAHTAKDVLGVDRVNAEVLTQFVDFASRSKLRVPFSDFAHVIICQLCVVMIFSMAVTSTSFGDTVSDVDRWCSREQMIWINAFSVVTPMEDLLSLWDLSEGQPVAETLFTVASNHAVTGAIQSTHPIPAPIGIGFIHAIPKPLPEGFLHVPDSHCSGLVADFAAGHMQELNNMIARKEG